MTGSGVVSLSPSVLISASVPAPSAVFSAPLVEASLFPSVYVALYEVSSVLPIVEILFLSAFVEMEYFVHFVLNASVGTDVVTLNIADRKRYLNEMSLCLSQQSLPL